MVGVEGGWVVGSRSSRVQGSGGDQEGGRGKGVVGSTSRSTQMKST